MQFSPPHHHQRHQLFVPSFIHQLHHRPCDDEWMIRAQILPMIATLLSWTWYVTLVMSLFGCSVFQLAMTNRDSKIAVYGCVTVAGICSMLCLCVWIMFTRAWFSDNIAYVPYFLTEMNEEQLEQQNQQRHCLQLVWGIVAYMCGMLWGATSCCVFYFVNRHTRPSLRATLSGRHGPRSVPSETERTSEEIPQVIVIATPVEIR